MTQFISESFNAPAGELLHVAKPEWAKVTGVTGDAIITSSGDRLRFSGATLYYLSSVPAPGANYSATVEIYIASTTTGPGVGVAVRMAGNAQTYYQARLLNGTGIQLYRVLNGTSTLLGSAPYTTVTGATLRIRLEVRETALNVYLDDAPAAAISTIDAGILEPGYVGIRAINAASQLLVESLSASTDAAVGVATDGTAVPVGVASAGQVGSSSASGTAAASAPGVLAAAAVSSASSSGTAQAGPTGVSAAASVGQVTASAVTAISGTALAPGVGAVSAVASAGAATASGSAGTAPNGVGSLASVGEAIAAGTIRIHGAAVPAGVMAHALVGIAGATNGHIFVRAPSGTGYAPQRNEHWSRPAQVSGARAPQVGGTRPIATEKANR